MDQSQSHTKKEVPVFILTEFYQLLFIVNPELILLYIFQPENLLYYR